MKIKAFARWTGTLFLVVTFAACGGGDSGGGTGGTTGSTKPVIGAAGGTVQGPNGSKIVIPPGSLATDTPIEITESSAGAPAFPGSFVAAQDVVIQPDGRIVVAGSARNGSATEFALVRANR